MAEEVLLNTETTVFIVGSNISIFTEYVEEGYPYILKMEIKDSVGMEAGVSYIEGELLVTFKNATYPQLINCYIDNEGNLILVGDDDVLNYSLDNDGNLIWSN